MASTPLLPGANHFISLEQAKQMTALFRQQKENILAPAYQGKDTLVVCETFNRDIFDAILGENGCVGMRIYYGMDPSYKVKAILVGVDAQNNDILPSQSSVAGPAADGNLGEYGQPCPPWCAPNTL